MPDRDQIIYFGLAVYISYAYILPTFVIFFLFKCYSASYSIWR